MCSRVMDPWTFSALASTQQGISYDHFRQTGIKLRAQMHLLNFPRSLSVIHCRPTMYRDVTVLPAKKDNYGVDSCSLIAITSSTPTTLVIAESTGRLHHCLISEVTEEDEVGESGDTHWSIYVIETIELELGMTIDPKERQYVCPVFMKRDPTNDSRYFAYHNAGLHAVTLKFTSALTAFLEESDELSSGTLELNEATQAEYLVCTKMSGVEKANVVLGFAFLQSPPVMMLYLNSGQVVSLDLINNTGVLDQYLGKRDTLSGGNKGGLNVSSSLANRTISESRQRAALVTQPILNLDKSTKLGPIQNIGVLQQVISTFKENYFSRLRTLQDQLERRAELLTTTKNQQIMEIRNLQSECDLIRENAENLAVKYEDIYEKHQEHAKRTNEVLRLATLHLPKNTGPEREFTDKVTAINTRTKALAAELVTMRAKMEQFKQHGEVQGRFKPQQQPIVLPPKREKVIMEIMGDM